MKKAWAKSKPFVLTLLILIGLVVLLVVLFFVLPKYVLPSMCDCIFGTSTHGIGEMGQFGDSFGVVNVLVGALAFGGVVFTLYYQYRSNRKSTIVDRYFKMLDFHNTLVSGEKTYPVVIKKDTNPNMVEGRKVFVEYKIQLKYLMQLIKKISEKEGYALSKPDIADISYAVFYYGSSPTWKPMMMEYLRDYDDTEHLVDTIVSAISKEKRYALSRPNQNFLSVYFRNMYNAIKLIDEATDLSEADKIGYVKLLRAQLCNAELYVLFFNLLSRFGKKWLENEYVDKYQLIQNMPAKYCDGYEVQDYFPHINFENSAQTRSSFCEVIAEREK